MLVVIQWSETEQQWQLWEKSALWVKGEKKPTARHDAREPACALLSPIIVSAKQKYELRKKKDEDMANSSPYLHFFFLPATPSILQSVVQSDHAPYSVSKNQLGYTHIGTPFIFKVNNICTPTNEASFFFLFLFSVDYNHLFQEQSSFLTSYSEDASDYKMQGGVKTAKKEDREGNVTTRDA